MKLLKGDGKTIEVRDVSEIIYQREAKSDLMIPLHGYKIMSDDEAREFLESIKPLTNNVKLQS